MNLLLIYPRFPDTFWSFRHALRFIGRRAALPPLGLLTVAALLPPAWAKRLVDVNVRELREEDLEWADLAFISAMGVQRESAEELIDQCRQAGVRTVAGGPLFTATPEEFPQVDHLVLNEAEITLPRFLADLEGGQAQRVYRTSEFADIQQTPAPLWELLDLKRYASMGLQYSRGCPYDCEFCNVTALLGHRPRTKTATQVIAELDGLRRAGWRGQVFFVDDNLIGNQRELKTRLLPALSEWRRQHGIRWGFNTEASINLADDEELMARMVEAGFTTVFIGIETPDEGSLAECHKRQNQRRDLVADIRRLHQAGLQVQGGFIVGFDSDTPSIFQRQVDLIQQSGVTTAMVGLLQALPGTQLYERMKREGRLRGLVSGDNVDGSTNIVPVMSLDLLRDGYKRLMAHLYSPEAYYQRVRTFLTEYRPPRRRPPANLQHLLAFARAAYRLGILGKERFHYWRLLAWALCRHPRLLPLAVTLSIYGHHFRRVCERHIV
ncbi:MAG: B12-binding domain-containing radical SAM protein [Candidatus Latescibacterota bacterium]|jgi:radical SAM superfamily enzyme YgiQ (UPF0313 family)